MRLKSFIPWISAIRSRIVSKKSTLFQNSTEAATSLAPSAEWRSIVDMFNPLHDMDADRTLAKSEHFSELQSFAEAYMDQFELVDGTMPFVYDPVHPEVDFQVVFVPKPGVLVGHDAQGLLTITLRAGDGTPERPFEEVMLQLDRAVGTEGAPSLVNAKGYRAGRVEWSSGEQPFQVSEAYIDTLKNIIYKNASSLEIVVDGQDFDAV